jgi:hypothetical protein
VLDKILYVSANQVVVYLDCKQPITVTSDNDTALSLALSLFTDDCHPSFAWEIEVAQTAYEDTLVLQRDVA